MQKRRTVILVMYDLPVQTPFQRKEGVRFRKYLLQHGYTFIQKSVYVRLLRNTAFRPEISFLKDEIPKDGTVNILPLPLEMFLNMEIVSEKPERLALFSEDLLVA